MKRCVVKTLVAVQYQVHNRGIITPHLQLLLTKLRARAIISLVDNPETD